MSTKNLSVDPKIYDENYYLSVCLGSEEFKKSGGKVLHPRLEKLLQQLPVTKDYRILDVGCGRGDITLYLGKNAKEAIGIDYSKAAIKIANSIKQNFPPDRQKRVQFRLMDIKQLAFPDNYFDLIIGIDVIEHLYKDEVEVAMKEMKRVLKKDGTLFIHTGTNKLLYEFTYKYYTLPVNKLLTGIDQLSKGVTYEGLPKDPRTFEEKNQHVNEPTYFYLKHLFKKYGFEGKIQIDIAYIKPGKGIKTIIYNALIAFYPLSKMYPLNILFGWVFICNMKNLK